MFRNYVTVALRYIAKYKGFSTLNIIGLAVGMAVCLLIMLWVQDELSYDRFHSRGDNIYRVNRTRPTEGRALSDELLSAPVGPKILAEVPEVASQCRVADLQLPLERDNKIYHTWGYIVDSSFFDIFSFSLERGDVGSVLSEPNSIILTEAAASRIFGEQDPVGQSLGDDLTVTGVLADFPGKSHLDFDFLVPMAYGEQHGVVIPDGWFNFHIYTYLLVHKGASEDVVAAKIKDIYLEQDPESHIELSLQPLKDIHLHNPGGGGMIVYVYIFSAIAMLVLLIACTNYMNLATARSDRRAKEIGLRKTVGASRGQLALQMLGESCVSAVVALLVAAVLVELVLPSFNDLAGKRLAMDLSGGTLLMLLCLACFTGLMSGTYPALYLSQLAPAAILKGTGRTDRGSVKTFLRRFMVVFQFVLTTGLILAALVIHNQLTFVRHKDLGITTDNVVCIPTSNLDSDYEALKHELTALPGVLGATASYDPPAYCNWWVTGVDYEGMDEDRPLRIGTAWVDFDFVDVFHLEVVQGRAFSRDFASDVDKAYLVNEAAVKAMGLKDPIGKRLDYPQSGTIVGVVKDFHFSSLHNRIRPLLLAPSVNYRYLNLLLASDDIPGTLARVEEVWTEFRPGATFSHEFLQDKISRNYRDEQRLGTIISSFTGLAVLVCVLGLLGLIAFATERRTREIAIRRVLGAPGSSVVRLLSREVILLVLIANIIAWPLAGYFCNRWLETFAYRIEISWATFAVVAALTLAVATATISLQILKAARTNPVEALRHE